LRDGQRRTGGYEPDEDLAPAVDVRGECHRAAIWRDGRELFETRKLGETANTVSAAHRLGQRRTSTGNVANNRRRGRKDERGGCGRIPRSVATRKLRR